MSELPRQRLFKAWADALARSQPELDPGVRRRVLAARTPSSRPQAFPTRYRFALAALSIVVAVAVALLVRAPARPSFQIAGRAGVVGAALSAPPTQELALRFSEGTQVSFAKGAHGRVTRLTPGGARVDLTSGGVAADVRHLPGADWSFGAGPFEVTVTGTLLDVSWSPDSGKFALTVSRGSVLVKGPFIAHAQEVRAGQVCRVDLNRRLMELGRLTADAAASLPEKAPDAVALRVAPEPENAAVAPPSSSSGVRSVTAESLLEEARAARLAGHPELERTALLACRRRAPGKPAAAQAAYLLGRSSSAAEAATWFETYLREMPGGLLAREAAGRLIESYQASSNIGAAQGAASRYLARYPNGPHAAMARRALAGRSESQD